MKYLGVDYGSHNIGIAVSDAGGSIAFPREQIVNDARAIGAILKLAKDERTEVVVVGDTRAINGGANEVTKSAEKFMAALEATGIKVEKVWEAWSSVEAARFAPKGKAHDDSAAAAVILQRYLDTKRGS